MIVAGFNFQKGRFRVVVLERVGSSITFRSRKAVTIDPDLLLPELAERYVVNFRGLCDEIRPSLIAAHQIYKVETVDASVTQVMPLGLLALVCHDKDIPLKVYNLQSFRSGVSFGLLKNQKPIEEIDAIFGEHPPYWDDIHKKALLAAWRALVDSPL